MRIEEPGWVRIGRFCSSQRRAIWARLVFDEGVEDSVQAVEMCAGREGDDVFVRFDRTGKVNLGDGVDSWTFPTMTAFAAILEVVLSGLLSAERAEYEGDPEAARQACVDIFQTIPEADLRFQHSSVHEAWKVGRQIATEYLL